MLNRYLCIFSGSHRASNEYVNVSQEEFPHAVLPHDHVQQYCGFCIHSSQFDSQLHQGQFCIFQVQTLLQSSHVQGFTGLVGSSTVIIQSCPQTLKFQVELVSQLESETNR